jgi:uncharacterized protein (DUF697 family)
MMPVNLEDLDRIRAQCRALVLRRASLSASVSIIPVPGLDVGTDVAILMRLLPAINERFGLSPRQVALLEPETRSVVMMLASALGSEVIGRIVTHELVMHVLTRVGIRLTARTATRWIPLVGQALAATISFAALRMLGNAHVEDCYRIARTALAGGPSNQAGGVTRWELVGNTG